jgi:hypothetical protein
MSEQRVFTGFWINRSQSTILGATITLPMRYANYVVSTLTVAVTVCASCAWIVAAFALHHILSSRKQSDTVGLQHQIILRNSGSPLSTLWGIIRIQVAWQKSARGLWKRSLSLAIPALLMFVLFAAASILVAEVASKSYDQIQVLLKPGDCGFWASNVSAGFSHFNTKIMRDTADARIYAANWYTNSTAVTAARALYPTTRLPYHTAENVSCPVAKRLCRLGENGAFEMETNVLDSHQMFGINAPPEDRIGFQKKTTCSVIEVDEFARGDNTTLFLFLGRISNGNNHTWVYKRVLTESGIDYHLL